MSAEKVYAFDLRAMVYLGTRWFAAETTRPWGDEDRQDCDGCKAVSAVGGIASVESQDELA